MEIDVVVVGFEVKKSVLISLEFGEKLLVYCRIHRKIRMTAQCVECRTETNVKVVLDAHESVLASLSTSRSFSSNHNRSNSYPTVNHQKAAGQVQLQHLGFLGIFKEAYKIIFSSWKDRLLPIFLTLIMPFCIVFTAEQYIASHLLRKIISYHIDLYDVDSRFPLP
ncbi:hypothetical protein Sjap_019738 [Stephania japonica]|uniref:Uncharacterized protein n=1 Tax=Stephania japonica TaxID=461633 RepID=A0AAP0F009_9MAGN